MLHAAPAPEPVVPAHTIVPAYFSAPALWREAASAGPGSMVIVNPNSGPGLGPDPAWRRIVRQTRARKVTLLGYVPTGYGEDPSSRVERQVHEYRDWYGIRGIFFDEVSDRAALLPRYRQMARTARMSGVKTIVLNPGTPPARGYFGIADAIVTFEAKLKAFESVTPPAWLGQILERKVGNIVFGVPRAKANAVTDQARRQGAGLVFITSDVLPNPYDILPGYFRSELRWLRSAP